jgi:hypothetical protein
VSTFTISGAGNHSLSPGTTALHLTVTTLIADAGPGSANPAAYYGLGLLRFSDGTGYWAPQQIQGGPQWIGVPYGATSLYYALVGAGAASVTEVIGGTSPFVGSLPSLEQLTDVAISSVADGQSIKWVASASQWQNYTPSSGGGGSASLLLDYTAATDLNSGTSVTANTWTSIGPNHSFTVLSGGSGLCLISVRGGAFLRKSSTVQASSGARLQFDSSTNVPLSGAGDDWMYIGTPSFSSNPFTGGSPIIRSLSPGAHHVQVQVISRDFNATLYCRPASQSTEMLAVQVVQLP